MINLFVIKPEGVLSTMDVTKRRSFPAKEIHAPIDIKQPSRQAFFTKFTVKTVIPSNSLLKSILNLPRYVCDGLKRKIFTPLLEMWIMLSMPTNKIEEISKREQRLLINEVRRLQKEFYSEIISIMENKASDNTKVIDQVQSLIKEFENKINAYCLGVLEMNNELPCAQRIKLIATLRDTLALKKDEYLITKAMNVSYFTKEFIDYITGALKGSIRNVTEALGEKYKATFSFFPATDILPDEIDYESINLSEKSVAKLLCATNKRYSNQVEADSSSVADIELPDNIVVPDQFARDIERGDYTFAQTDNLSSCSTMNAKDNGERRSWDKVSFIKKLQTLTNNRKAIYTICSHLTQAAGNSMNHLVGDFMNQSLAISCTGVSTLLECYSNIEKDPDDENKIIITHHLMIKHQKILANKSFSSLSSVNEDRPDGMTSRGPSALLISLPDDDCDYLSYYRQDWIHTRIESSIKVTVDLRRPDCAVVENKGPCLHLPGLSILHDD